MRFSLLVISFLLTMNVMATVQDGHYSDLFSGANQAYKSGAYDSAKTMYNEVFQNGMVSPELFYNLGNTHYREGNYPAAILFYERALKLAPADDDIKYNLGIAQQFVTDKIEPIEPFFLTKWWVGASKVMSADQWSYIFLIVLTLACALFSIYFISKVRATRQLGFIGGIIGLIIAGVFFSLASTAYGELSEEEAIVFAPSAKVKSAPGLNSTDQFVIHAGLKVKVVDEDGDWTRIELLDGNSGWIYSQSIERI